MSEKDEKALILQKNAGEIALGRTKNMLSAAASIIANAPVKRKAEGLATLPPLCVRIFFASKISINPGAK